MLGNLTKLETLSLNGNRLTMIPSTVFIKMKNLTTLSLCNNKLRIFPMEICELTKLDVVDLSGNLMDHIPDAVGCLKAMELNLNGNRLTTLPPSLVNCERLKVLRVEENCLGLEAISTELLKDSQIAVLAVDGNLFQMKELRDKDGYEKVSILSVNFQIKHVPGVTKDDDRFYQG